MIDTDVHDPEEDLTEHRLTSLTIDQRHTLRVSPCGCECCYGGFCGGCGHAGCGGRTR